MSLTVPVYSIAKVYTALAALASFDLDDDVGAYVSQLRPDLAALSLRDLLTHRSGLNDYAGWPDYRAAVEAREEPWSHEHILERAEVGVPGEFRYSNIGFLLVRQALEQAHGKPYFEVLAERVFEPLGVQAHPFASLSDWRRCDHPAIDAGLRSYHPGWVYPGTFAADPHEVARGLALAVSGALGEATARALRVTFDVDIPPSHPMSPGAGYGLGVMTSGTPVTALGHGGQGPGFTLFAATNADGSRWHGEVRATEGEDTELIRRCLKAVRPGGSHSKPSSGPHEPPEE